MVMNIFLFLSMYPIIFILYFVMKNEAVKKHGTAYGIQLPTGEKSKEYSLDQELDSLEEQYKKEMKIDLIILAIIPFAALFIPYFSISFTIWMVWTFAAVGLFFVPYVKANKKLKQILIQHGHCDFSAEKGWIWGIFYYNKEDKHILINNKMGTGQSVNMATPVGLVLEILVVLTILAVPFLCGWLIAEEFTPIQLSVEEDMLVAHQISNDYEIAVEDITKVSLIKELPRMSKRNGSAIDELYKGSFYIRNVGECEVFLNPTNTEFLTFEAEGVLYYMSGIDDDSTEAVYEELLEMEE